MTFLGDLYLLLFGQKKVSNSSNEVDVSGFLKELEAMRTTNLVEVLSRPWNEFLTPEENAEHQRALESVVEARAYAEAHAHEFVIWR